MDASAQAFANGIRRTRIVLAKWNRRPGPVLARWVIGSVLAACALLLAVLTVAELAPQGGSVSLERPPLIVGHPGDVVRIAAHNSLVLALHAMACLAGFMAGSSLPIQAARRAGLSRTLHERGARFAILFVVGATTFSLSVQTWVLGSEVARVARALHTSPALLLVTLLPHALVELTALFLPLAAWIIASRRGEWDTLLAAALVTSAIALPTLVASAVWEVYVAPHLVAAVVPQQGALVVR